MPGVFFSLLVAKANILWCKASFYPLTDCRQTNLQFISYHSSPRAGHLRVKWSVLKPKCPQLHLWSLWRWLTNKDNCIHGHQWWKRENVTSHCSWNLPVHFKVSRLFTLPQLFFWTRYKLCTKPLPLLYNFHRLVMIHTGNAGCRSRLHRNVFPLAPLGGFCMTANS